MVFDQKKFYKDFLSSKEGMATNILSDRLKKLEAIGVVESQVYPKRKTMKEYTLTRKGRDLIPILLETIVWSAKHRQGLAIPSDFLKMMNMDRAKVIANVEAGLDG